MSLRPGLQLERPVRSATRLRASAEETRVMPLGTQRELQRLLRSASSRGRR